ncbi:MAG: cyclic di-GMP-binding protein MapZ [Rhodoferax sp.]
MNDPQAGSLRVFSRVPFSAAVTLEIDGQSFAVSLLDIALKGALVRTDGAVPARLSAACNLVLPLSDGGEAIVMHGRVAHINGSHMGLACEHIDLDSLTRLRRLMELNTGDADLMDRELSRLFHTG